MEDRLLQELARVARQEEAREKERLDERWDALSAGTLTADEEAELRALADGSDDAALAWRAFRPLDNAARSRIVDRVRRETTRQTPATTRPPARSSLAAVLEALLRPRTLVPLAAAAVLAAVLLWPAGPQPPLDDYRLALTGGVQSLRSGEPAGAGAPLFVDGNRLELVLTPEATVAGPLAARVYVAEDGAVRAVDGPPVEISDLGAVRWVAVLGRDLELAPGTRDLLVVVGRPGRLPAADELAARLRDRSPARSRDWLAWSVPVRVE